MRSPSGEIPTRPESGRLPATIGPYRIEREIGRGAVGVVYSVTREGHQGSYALKLIRDLEGIDEEGLVRFQREAQLSSRLTHPGVVGALDAGAAGRHRYLVLPLVQGESLAERLRRERALPPQDAATLIARVADALATVHAAGVIHRDIKPDNILLDQAQGGAPRLTDFGIAREGHGHGSLTQSSAFLGTPAYMAPEQIQAASRVDGKADVYSLASVLYECLSGLPPFQGATFQVADQVLHKEPPHLSEVAPGVPRAIAEACHAALAKDPQARPDAAAFAERLRAAVLLEEPGEGSSASKLTLAVALLAALVALGCWGAFQLTSSEEPPRRAAAPAEPVPTPSPSAPEPTTLDLAALREQTHAEAPLDPTLVEALSAEMEDPEQASAAALVLADYLLRRGDLTRAAEVLRQIPESATEGRRARLLETRILFRLGRNEQADALESDLLLQNLEDGVGRLIRARRLMSWDQKQAGYELLRPLLAEERPDPIAVDLALNSNRLRPEAARALLERAALAGDPALLLYLSRIQRAEDPSQADATLARAEALCAPRDCGPALLLRVRSKMHPDGTAGPGLLELVKRCHAAEPSTLHSLLLLIYGKLPEDERQRVATRLRQQAPAQFAVYIRSQGPDSSLAEPPHHLATPFFPGDESWSWARERVAELPERARRHGFRALTAAIGGTRDWSYVSRELNLAAQADETKAARGLAVEVCVRRGRLAEALEFSGSLAAIPPLLRARFEFYRGHESSAFDALRDASAPLAEAETLVAKGQPEEASRRLGELEPSVDVRLAEFEAAFALEQKKEAVEGNSLNFIQLRARVGRGADEVARKPIRESLAKVQAAIGCLDLRLGVAYELLDLRNRYRAGRGGWGGRRGRRGGRRRQQSPPAEQIGPREPIERAIYYAGDGLVPSVYFLRRALFYAVHQNAGQRNASKLLWGPILIPRLEGFQRSKAPPALNLFLASLDIARGQQRITAARAADPLVELPEHMLPLVEGRRDRDLFFPEK